MVGEPRDIRCGSVQGPHVVERAGRGARLAGRWPDHAQPLARDAGAQMRLARTVQALLGPALAEAERAVAVAAAGDDNTAGATTQGIFDERGWQLAGADQAQRDDVVGRQRGHRRPLLAADDDELARAAQRDETGVEVPAQRV